MSKEDKIIQKKDTGKIYYKKNEIGGTAHKSWYRGSDCNFNPNKINILQKDAIERYILKGWLPEEPFLDKNSSITAFGSCFAKHISEYLEKKGYNVVSSNDNSYIDFRAGVNNVFAIRQLLEFVFLNKAFAEETWHRDDKTVILKNQELRNKTLKLFINTDLFIITLGLSEIWYNKETNDAFWRAIPVGQFDERVHSFKVASFAETKENIKIIYTLIKKYNPKARVLFTISPVPLVATFRPVSCITANAVSKALLRAAIDEFYRDLKENNDESLFYWPSYEIIEKIFTNTIEGGAYIEDCRHIKLECVEMIMKLFEKYYIKDNEGY